MPAFLSAVSANLLFLGQALNAPCHGQDNVPWHTTQGLRESTPLGRVEGLFQSETGHPNSALAHKLLQMNGLWASRTSFLFWQVGQMMGSILELADQLGEVPGLESLCQ